MADVLAQLGDGTSVVRLKDMNDGSVAAVVMAGSSSASAAGDVLADLGDGVSKVRLRNMGDGTFAKVIFGK